MAEPTATVPVTAPAPAPAVPAPAAAAGEQRGDRGGRGFGRPGDKGGKGPRGPPRKKEEQEWIPVTKLGRLVKAGKIECIEQIFRFSLPIKGKKKIKKNLLFGSLHHYIRKN